MKADRQEVFADGEDVAMFAVEVHDAQGRVVPITDNEVTFRVSGAGKLIGVGNGDPTDQESDKGSSRKAFSGLCMAVVQSTKTAGNITVEATSPGLAPASVTIGAKSVALRPQVSRMGARSAEGFRHYRPVETGAGFRRHLWPAFIPGRRWHHAVLSAAGRRQPNGKRGRRRRRILWRQRCARPDRGRQSRGQHCLLQDRKQHLFGNAERRPNRA